MVLVRSSAASAASAACFSAGARARPEAAACSSAPATGSSTSRMVLSPSLALPRSAMPVAKARQNAAASGVPIASAPSSALAPRRKPVAVSVPMVEGAVLAMIAPAERSSLVIPAAGPSAVTVSAAAAKDFAMVMPRSLSPTLPSSAIRKSRCAANMSRQRWKRPIRSSARSASMRKPQALMWEKNGVWTGAATSGSSSASSFSTEMEAPAISIAVANSPIHTCLTLEPRSSNSCDTRRKRM